MSRRIRHRLDNTRYGDWPRPFIVKRAQVYYEQGPSLAVSGIEASPTAGQQATSTISVDDTLSFRWLDQTDFATIWRTDWATFPAGVHDTSGTYVMGWNLNDGYQIYITDGDLIVERRSPPLAGTIPKPSSVKVAVDGAGILHPTV